MIIIDINTQSRSWLNFIKPKSKLVSEIKEITSLLISFCPIDNFNAYNNDIEIAISLSDNDEITKLNNKFRQKNNATNVLSFPSFDKNEINKIDLTKSDGNYIFLGDIILSYDKIEQESKEQNKKFTSHLTHLILHSILHLLGFDHIDDEEAKIMENMEIEILKKLNISNPY